MIILLHGTDRKKSLKKYQAYLKTLQTKHLEASVFLFDVDHFSTEQFQELVVGQTLFYNKYIVGCDNLLQNSEAEGMIKEKLKELAASDNVFILLENKLTKELLTKLKKQAWKEEEFNLEETGEKGVKKKADSSKLFAVGDAVMTRDRKRAWVAYEEALRAGQDPVDVFWTISWTVKNLLLVKTAKKTSELGLNPYVLRKTEAGAGKYNLEEARTLSDNLMALFHTTFSETEEFEVGLERILLGL